MSLSDTDEIPVLVTDLRMVLRALNAAYGSQAAWDLLEQYRGMAEVPRKSNLARALEGAYNRVHGYITEAEKDNPGPIKSVTTTGHEGEDG